MSPIARNTITRAKGLSGLPPTTKYHVSGLLYYEAVANIPAGFGTGSGPPVKVYSLAQAVTLGIPKGDANLGDLYYHVEQYFTQNPNGELWIGIYDAASVGSYADMDLMAIDANNEIRLMGVYETESPLYADTGPIDNVSVKGSALQTQVDKAIARNAPYTVLFGGDIQDMADINTIASAAGLTASSVRFLIGQDIAGDGAALFASIGKSITNLGAELGAWSKVGINKHIGEPGLINLQVGSEFDKIGFGNGQEITSAFTDTQLDALTDKALGFMIRRITLSGAFVNDSRTAVVSTDDYAFVENDRTINEGVRLADAALEPLTYSQMVLNADGTLAEEERNNIAGRVDQYMSAIGFALSNPPGIIVDPTLTVNNEVQITINLQKTLTNRGFNVTIGLVKALS